MNLDAEALTKLLTEAGITARTESGQVYAFFRTKTFVGFDGDRILRVVYHLEDGGSYLLMMVSNALRVSEACPLLVQSFVDAFFWPRLLVSAVSPPTSSSFRLHCHVTMEGDTLSAEHVGMLTAALVQTAEELYDAACEAFGVDAVNVGEAPVEVTPDERGTTVYESEDWDKLTPVMRPLFRLDTSLRQRGKRHRSDDLN